MPHLGTFTLVVLSLGVAGYAIAAYAFLPLGAAVHPGMRASFELHRAGVYAHVFAASVALALGPFQFFSNLRARHAALHRAFGRVYLGIGVLVGGLSGLYLALQAFGGPVARLGFGCLALSWLVTGLLAYRAIRAGDVATHRRWMTRNFALSFAAVMLRLYVPGAVVSGIAFEAAYPVIAWACWVPNLVVAELWFVRPRAPVHA
jgi:uncharacterized membrane protein